jgi:hypothetical protein
MLQKILEIGKSYKIAVMGFLLIFCLLATFYFHFILKIEHSGCSIPGFTATCFSRPKAF